MSFDAFLDITDIPGESQAKGFEGKIQVLSYSFGGSQSGTAASGTGGAGAGKASFNDFTCSIFMSKATPLLMKACATGEHKKNAVLTVRKAAGDQEIFCEIKFETVMITSYVTGGSSEVPVETISFNYGKITYDYKPQADEGTVKAKVSAGYDLKL